MIRGVSIELKMIAGAIFFVVLLLGLERYEFSQNITQQFLESKKGKNKLLIDTISPIIGLNISLGLESANQEYLTQIVKQNRDLESFELTGADGKKLYYYSRKSVMVTSLPNDGIYHAVQSIADPLTGEKIATVSLYFDNHEYRAMVQKNQEVSLKIIMIVLVVLVGFIVYIKQEFVFLKKLSEHVLQYDPQLNNFTLTDTNRKDEVGIIHNAIISMVTKISTYAALLDDLNQSLSVKVQERTKELEEANIHLKELSLTDSLTQLPNRRDLENHLQNTWELAKRKQVVTSIIMCDIDFFKQVNDKYGHIIGDFVLKDIAQILKTSLKRKSDFVARYGGEEFMIVLYETDILAAEELCTTIQKNLKKANGFKYRDIQLEPITLSFGISSIIPDEMSLYTDLINLADMALYQAKERGRNCFISITN